MADTLKFGPEWLRQLSSGGSMTSPPPSPSFGGKYKLADNRYGREEMLALFTPNAKAPDDLRQFSHILVERCQDPMATINPTEAEQHLLSSNVNSTVARRQMMGRGNLNERVPPGMRGTGRGGLSSRGRGRGKSDSGGFYQRGFEDPLPGRGESGRGRGIREGGATKVIERDSSGFLSARTFDESTNRRGKDPFSRSVPSSGDRWTELRSARTEPGGGRSGTAAADPPTDEPNTPGAGEEKDDDWRRAGKDRQPRGNWRDAKPSFEDDNVGRYSRGASGFGRQISYERSRSHKHEEADELPEWATDDMGAGDEGGTFDASGAFLSSKDTDSSKSSSHNGASTKQDRKQEINKAKKALPPLKINPQGSSAAQESPPVADERHLSSQTPPVSSQAPPNSHAPPTTQSTANISSISTDIPSNHSTLQTRDTTSQQNTPQGSQQPPAAEQKKEKSTAEAAPEPEADFDHLTKAAEEMMATWAAEDDDHPDPSTADHPDHWFYKDPQGILQGPFSAQEMAEWYGAGYFTMTLLVKKGSDTHFQPLGEIIKRGGNTQPFVPTPPALILNPLAVDPAILAAQAQQDPLAIQQQMFLLQQQQAIVQHQRLVMLRQQQQLQHIMQTLGSNEQYSKLSAPQLRSMAVAILQKDQQKQLNPQPQLPQGLLEASPPLPAVQRSSPPQQTINGANIPAAASAPLSAASAPLSADDEMLWGAATRSWTRQMREKEAVGEMAQKMAARQQEQQRADLERQLEQQQRLEHQQRMEVEMLQEREKQLEEQRLLEKRRAQEEKVKEEIRLQREEMERLKREQEERKRQEIERQELEVKKQKEQQLARERQRELERQKQVELERQAEVDKQLELDKKRKAEQRKRDEEERKHKEALEAEMARRAEQQRLDIEKAEREMAGKAAAEKERERQAERERLEALKLPSSAQWASNSNNNIAPVYDRQLSLQEIQKKEKEQAAKDKAAKIVAEKQRQLELQELANQQTQLKWANSKSQSPVNVGKSLRQIQEEEALRLEEEMKEQLKKKPTVVTNTPLATAPSWGSSKPVPVTGWASEGAWGNAVRKGTWDQPASKPAAKTSNSEVFPSLSATAKQTPPAPAVQQKKKPTAAQSNKKVVQNNKVKKIFQSASGEDKFTVWCTKALQQLNSAVDVPTFISFLREVENPYEVQDYVNSYLGETSKSTQFAKEFIERRSVANKEKLAKQRLDDEESLWGPAPAVNPSSHRSAASESANSAADKKKKAAKKTKGQKTDASALLGFTVGASSHRLNIGEIEKAD